ncbi:MAG: 16S rRNA processing protein RimM, partial [Eubacterium sp.]|nr:16S rRNA processing protein RimM [Eubacterium sp.]
AREDAVPLGENEWFIADLIGMDVYTEDGLLGKLTDVMQTGANDVYCVQSPVHGEVLIPAIKQCIMNVNVEGGRMDVHLLPGLIQERKK